MTQHLPENKHWQIATFILEGLSFSEVADRFNISKGAVHKIFHKMKFKVFPMLSERDRLGINMNDIKSLRDSWAIVKPF